MWYKWVMKACIYARTSKIEKRYNTTSIANQVAQCRELAGRHNIQVEHEHIFTDQELQGSCLPDCWEFSGNADTRPALSALIEAVERHEIKHVLVTRYEKLGTSSEILTSLLQFLSTHHVTIISNPEQIEEPENHAGRFAASILKPVVQVDTGADQERKRILVKKKLEEIERLKAKLHRLETELSDLQPDGQET
jgi:DNA invertase Pin-like site-specific DNA recombinase